MPKLSLAAILLCAAPLCGQQTGVSHPDEASIEANGTAAVPVVEAPVLVVPATATPVAAAQTSADGGSDSPAVTLKRHDLAKFAVPADPDGAIVEEEPSTNPGEIATGTLVRARLKTAIETATTQSGTPFRAEVAEAVLQNGRVVVPGGSMLEGRVTEIRGGRRVGGRALIHLQVQTIVLPDGARMPITASVVDTDQFAETRIDGEGNIVRKDHPKRALATLSLATGGAAAAGGVIAGVPGALIGAGIGAGVSTVMWLKQDRQTQLPAGTLVTLALTEPLRVQPTAIGADYAGTLPARPATAQPPSATVAVEPQAYVPVE